MSDEQETKPTPTSKGSVLAATLLSLIVPGLGSAYLRAWRSAVTYYGLGLASTAILFVELHPRIASVSRYLVLVGVTAISAAIAAHKLAREGRSERLGAGWITLLALLHVTVVAPLTVTQLMPLTPFRIDAHSMAPTLQVGDYFMARKRRWPFTEIARGDVVLFALDDAARINVKRVVAIGGDLVDACGYDVRVNGVTLDEPYVKHRPRALKQGCVPTRVPPDHIFVLGDNRLASSDSRDHGSVPSGQVVAHAWFVWFAQDRERLGDDVR